MKKFKVTCDKCDNIFYTINPNLANIQNCLQCKDGKLKLKLIDEW